MLFQAFINYFSRWLATDEGDGKVEVELYPTRTRQQDRRKYQEISGFFRF